jgi:hypothetical protein
MHLKPVGSFGELTDYPVWADELEGLRRPRTRRLMLGMFAEPKPFGFAFSDTPFRIFILMASRPGTHSGRLPGGPAGNYHSGREAWS